MKKLFWFMVGFWLVFSVGMAQAAPFLVCNAPDPAEQVISYIVYQDEVVVGTPLAQPDGSLRKDLQSIPQGTYTWTIEAVNAWGVSETSDPYISPSSVTKPLNTRMVP